MKRLWGYLSIITATIFFGISATLDKIMLSEMHPVTIGAYTYIIAGLFLFSVRQSPLGERIISILNSETLSESDITRRDYAVLFITSLLGTVIAPIIFLNGLNDTTAVNASLLLNVEVLFIIILGYIIFREVLRSKDITGILLIITGAVFLVTDGRIPHVDMILMGDILVIGAAFFWSLDTVLSKFLSKKRDLVLVSGIKSLFGGVILLLLIPLLGFNPGMPLHMVPYALAVAVFSIGCSFILIYTAIRELGASMVGALFPLSSLFGAIFAAIILQEPLTVLDGISGAVMLAGVFILYWNGR